MLTICEVGITYEFFRQFSWRIHFRKANGPNAKASKSWLYCTVANYAVSLAPAAWDHAGRFVAALYIQVEAMLYYNYIGLQIYML